VDDPSVAWSRDLVSKLLSDYVKNYLIDIVSELHIHSSLVFCHELQVQCCDILDFRPLGTDTQTDRQIDNDYNS